MESRKTDAIDLIRGSDDQTITKTEFMAKMNYQMATTESTIKRLRNYGEIITVATEEDTLLIGSEYAKANGIKPLSRNELKKTTREKLFVRKSKQAPEPKPKALNINDLWLPVSHREIAL